MFSGRIPSPAPFFPNGDRRQGEALLAVTKPPGTLPLPASSKSFWMTRSEFS
jgi:hypothetical protein